MKRNLLTLVLLVASISLQAQIIKGKIIDNANQPIEFATVVLQSVDSTYINSAITDLSGDFEIKSELNKFRLICQHLLYETKEQVYNNQQAVMIVLSDKENQLNEVVVKGEHPVVKLIEGKLTYDMPRLLEGKVISNAYESILQLPGVREQEGNIILAGANRLTVILNGKPTSMTSEQLTDLLKSMPQTRIEKAEVMYSAPPQYHVNGAAINIVLKKEFSDISNLQGQVNSGYTQKHYESYNGGASLLYSTSKLSLDMLYNIRQGRSYSGIDISSLHLFNDSIHSIEQINRGRSKGLSNNIRLGADYAITANDKLGVAYTAQITPTRDHNETSTGSFSNSITDKTLTDPTQMHNFSVNYTSGFGMELGADYTYYNTASSQDFIDKNNDLFERSFLTYTNQKINRLDTYLDQSHQLPNEWTLNYGAKFSYASDNSKQTYESRTQDDLSGLNTDSKQNEYTYNLYAGFDKSFTEKLSMSASLKGEYYRVRDLKEWALFPTAQVSYLFSPVHILQLSVSSEKIYPDYWEMHGAIGYINGYTELHGNPLLRPYKDYTSQLSYIFKGKYVVTGYFTHVDDYFVQLPYQSSDKLSLIYKTTNFDYLQKIGVNIVAPFQIGKALNTRVTLNGFYDRAKNSRFHDITFDNSRVILYARVDNSLKLSSRPNIMMEFSGSYLTPSIQGPGDLSKIWGIDAGVKWTFAKEKAELRLKGVDLFNSWTPDYLTTKYSTQNLRMGIVPDSRAISLSFTYKFGGYKEKARKDVDTSRFGK